MAKPIDADWATDPLSDGSLNKVTIGQGTAFPSSWPLDRIFWRTDTNVLYKNVNTIPSPTWQPIPLIEGKPISTDGSPTTDDVLKYNGTDWETKTGPIVATLADTNIGANDTTTSTGYTNTSCSITLGNITGGKAVIYGGGGQRNSNVLYTATTRLNGGNCAAGQFSATGSGDISGLGLTEINDMDGSVKTIQHKTNNGSGTATFFGTGTGGTGNITAFQVSGAP